MNTAEKIAEEAVNNAETKKEWKQPEKIENNLLPVPALPINIIPEPYRAWITDIAHRMQSPPDMAAAASIVMTGAVIGAGCGIRPKQKDDWLVIPNLYGAIIGRPSIFMKSPTLAEIMKPIARLEAQAMDAYATSEKYHAAEVEFVKAKRESIRKEIGKSVKNDSASVDLLKSQFATLDEPEAPTWRRYRTNDSTIEKMSELLNENPRGILVLWDELSGLLASWEREGHEQDRAFYLEGWNGTGDKFTDRIGRGTIYTRNMCLSIFGGIQPLKLQQYLYANRLTNDGMFQRFQMVVCPDEQQHWQLIDEYPDKEAKNKVYDIIKALADMDFIAQCGAIKEEHDKIPYLRFTDDAQQVFNEWLTTLETEKIRGDDDPIVIEHLSKYRKLMPALALIFHLIDVVAGTATGAVSKKAAELAAAWCDYLEEHARRIYGLAGSLPQQAAQSLSRRLVRGEVKKECFTVRDIYRNQWTNLTDKEVVQAACDILVDKNWLAEQKTSPDFQQRAKTEYLINPKVRGFYG